MFKDVYTTLKIVNYGSEIYSVNQRQEYKRNGDNDCTDKDYKYCDVMLCDRGCIICVLFIQQCWT